MRSLKLAQQLLLQLGCHVVPGQTALAQADKVFGASGALTDARALMSVQSLAKALVDTTRKLSAATGEGGAST